MKAERTGCCRRPHEPRGVPPDQTGRFARGAVGGVMFAVLAALMPKCPLCIAAWLGVLGLSGLAARVEPRGLWLALAAASALAAALLVHWLSARLTHAKKGQRT